MNIDRQRKLLQFRKSKINLALNIIHVLLFFITMGGYILFFTLIILLSGLSMWRASNQVGMPLDVSIYNSVEDISDVHVHLIDFQDSNLRYEVYANITTTADYTVYIDDQYGLIDKMYLDDNEIFYNEENRYVIPAGTYDIKLEMINNVDVETFKCVTSAEIYLTDYEQTTLSSYFRPFPRDQEPTFQSVTLITASSTGKYVPKMYRAPIFQAVLKVQQVLIIYTVLNMIKIIVLFFFTSSARRERKINYQRPS